MRAISLNLPISISNTSTSSGYIISDSAGTEYLFYGEEGEELEYDGFSQDLSSDMSELIDERVIEFIAKVAHQANKAFCSSIGDDSQVNWEDAPQWQKDSAVSGVMFTMKNMNSKPEDSHKSWMSHKRKEGWVYGEIKDSEKKTHPCMVAYKDLPTEQRSKDYIYQSIVKTLIIENHLDKKSLIKNK